MKCHYCQSLIPSNGLRCPNCEAVQRSASQSLIAEHIGVPPRRTTGWMMQTLRYGLLAGSLLGLALAVGVSAARFFNTDSLLPKPSPQKQARSGPTPKPDTDPAAGTAPAEQQAATRPPAPAQNETGVPATKPAAAHALDRPAPTAPATVPPQASTPPESAPPEVSRVEPPPSRTESAPAPRDAATAEDALPADSPNLEAENIGLSPQTGLLTIKSYIPARVYIDGQFSGLTPRTVKLSAGEHVINLMAEGHVEWSRKVSLKGKQQVGVVASMQPKVRQAENR